MKSKTLRSTIQFNPDVNVSDKAFNNTITSILNVINDVGLSGGLYVGDGINVKTTLTYQDQTETFTYSVPINNEQDVAELNDFFGKMYADYSEDEKIEHGVRPYYSFEEHIEKCMEMHIDKIKQLYHNNNKPTSGSIMVKTIATYEPEDK